MTAMRPGDESPGYAYEAPSGLEQPASSGFRTHSPAIHRRAGAVILVLALLVALSLTLALPAAAQRVTLTLRDAELSRVMAELRAQSGFDMQYVVAPDERARAQRHSFSWKEAPLKEALRQVGAAYGYTFRRNSPTSFWGQPGAPPPERRRPGIAIGDLNLYVDRLTISEMRSLQPGTGESSATQSFTIELVAEGPTEEAVDAIYGFDTAVEAIDDQGNRLVSEVRGFNSGPGSRYPSPDQWRQYLTLPAPSARAKKLASLTGEMVLYREVRSARLEIPLPLPQRPFTRSVGDVALTVTEARARGGDFFVRATVSWPGGVGSNGDQDRTLRPLLFLASGDCRRPGGMEATPANTPQPLTGGGATSDAFRSEQRIIFNGLSAPATKLVFDVTTRARPERRVRYRIADIPLPPPAPSPGRAAPVHRPSGSATAGVTEIGAETPFSDPRGGTLVVRVAGAPRGSRLSLGLSHRDGNAWSAWRWADVALSPDGAARLGPLRPGTYRLRASITRADGSVVSAAAKERTVQVSAARETSVDLSSGSSRLLTPPPGPLPEAYHASEADEGVADGRRMRPNPPGPPSLIRSLRSQGRGEPLGGSRSRLPLPFREGGWGVRRTSPGSFLKHGKLPEAERGR